LALQIGREKKGGKGKAYGEEKWGQLMFKPQKMLDPASLSAASAWILFCFVNSPDHISR